MEGMDLTDIANMDHLPLAKYYCTDREWADFAAGGRAATCSFPPANPRPLLVPPPPPPPPPPPLPPLPPLLRRFLWSAAPAPAPAARPLSHHLDVQPAALPTTSTGRLDEEEEVLLLERMSTALLADEHYAQKQATVATAVSTPAGCLPLRGSVALHKRAMG